MLTDRLPPAAHRSPAVVSAGNGFGALLQNYFRSGWAFLIPYLAAYLLYAWLKWPVNPVAAGSSPVDGGQLAVSAIGALPPTVTPSTAHSLLSTGVPCLLHVYWFLHALHLVLGALALRAWWKESGATVAGATDDSENTANHSATPQPLVSPKSDVGGSTDSPSTVHRAAQPLLSTVPQSGHRLPSTVYRLLPWIFLALLFYIPGVYLEFPADTWEHYLRVNEWSSLELVAQHFTWEKSSYFLAYSLNGQVTPPLLQLKWFDVYYTGCCLLLCWQYYRLAHAVGLGKRASMIFVILQALLMGNNIFGFYRYYGMSSSLFAQLGAVALIRVVLEALRVRPQQASGERQLSTIPALSSKTLATNDPRYFLPQCASALALVALTVCNHVQGLGIAALGIAAVVVWRLIEWRRSMVWWLALAAIGLSVATILWFHRKPALDEIYRPQGWLTPWYGFNLFQPSSPAFDRAAAILGAAGLLNLFAGFWLLRRNHVAAWFTLMPVIALCLPFVAIPYLQQLIHSGQPILVFHRMLFAIPGGLAIVELGAGIMKWEQETPSEESDDTPQFSSPVRSGLEPARQSFGDGGSATYFAVALSSPNGRNRGLRSPFCLVPLAFCALILAPASNPSFNRLYNTLMRPPADLSMHHVLAATELLGSKSIHLGINPVFIATTGISSVFYSTGARNVLIPWRLTFVSIAKTAHAEGYLAASVRDKVSAIYLLQTANELYTPLSITAFLSRHWQQHVVALEHSNVLEAERMALELGYHKMEFARFTYYFYSPK